MDSIYQKQNIELDRIERDYKGTREKSAAMEINLIEIVPGQYSQICYKSTWITVGSRSK